MEDTSAYEHIFYTGPLNQFCGYWFSRLAYHMIYFEQDMADGDYQENAVINYSDVDVPFTLVHGHKH